MENYFKTRMALKNHPQILDLHDFKIGDRRVNEQVNTSMSSSNICSVRSFQHQSNDNNEVYLLVEALPTNLEN